MPFISPIELAQLMRAHSDALVFYASQWTPNPDDCVQESLIDLAMIDRPENPKAWLYHVVRSKAINASRAHQRRSKHEKFAAQLQAAELDTTFCSLELAEDQQVLMDAIGQLEPDLRELIVLRIWSNLTWAEIAKLTSRSSSAAHRQYTSALKQLKAMIHHEAIDYE